MKRNIKRNDRGVFLSTLMGFGIVAGLSHRRAAKAATKVITQEPHGPNGSGSDGRRE
jgi:hypothetical protein